MLGSALYDRARILPREQSGTRVEGRYVPGDPDTSTQPMLRCMYDPGNESESREAARIRRTRPATLLVGRRALDGSAVAIRAQDRVEIHSRAFGVVVMEVQGAPQPLMKRRTLVGWTVELHKVTDGRPARV